jgi:TRAP-type C4-dicarboxylate transport system permease small subunit
MDEGMFFRVIERIAQGYGWVMAVLMGTAIAVLVPMMFLVAGDVIGRYLLKQPIPAVFEINSHFLMVLVVFFPLAYVQRRKEHVFVTVFTEKFPPRAKALLDTLSILIGIIAFGLIGWYGLDVALVSTRVGDHIPGIIDVPVWISKWFVPIGAFALCLELLIDGARHVQALITGESK